MADALGPFEVGKVHCSDCPEAMRQLPDGCVDAVVTDPPYELGFMGKRWDRSGVAFRVETWAAALRVAKPGAHLLAFGGTRTFHRLACAIEDAGWEIRDCIMWVYGSGFPKSLDVSKAIDKAAGAKREVMSERQNRSSFDPNGEGGGGFQRGTIQITSPSTAAARQWAGWGTALKPAWEPVIVARKPLCGTVAENVLKHGTGALNIDGCRVGTNGARNNGKKADSDIYGKYGPTERIDYGKGRFPANLIHDGSPEVLAGFPKTGQMGSGSGSGSGGIWAASTGKPAGPQHGDSGSAARFFYCAKTSRSERDAGMKGAAPEPDAHNLSSNACGRCGLRVKANGSGQKCECGELRETVKLPRSRNHHPTVKPISLMRYCCRLVTPPGGIVLDPFAGSASTLCAAELEGFRALGFDLSAEYVDIGNARLAYWRKHPEGPQYDPTPEPDCAGQGALFGGGDA